MEDFVSTSVSEVNVEVLCPKKTVVPKFGDNFVKS